MRYAEGSEDLLLLEVAQALAADALDDLGRQQDALALVAEIGIGVKQQAGVDSALDKGAQRRVGAAVFRGSMSGRPEVCESRWRTWIAVRSQPRNSGM